MTFTYPTHAELEVPLLKAISKRGGELWFSTHGIDLEIELAEEFDLSREAREYSSGEIHAQGNRKWRNVIQYVRLDLVQKMQLDNSRRDLWKLTESGYRRIGE